MYSIHLYYFYVEIKISYVNQLYEEKYNKTSQTGWPYP
jgi:hypothetical protein